MNDSRSKERFLGFLNEEIHRRAPQGEAAVLKAFAAEVIGAMDFEDVRDRRPADVCATILYAWRYLQQYDPAGPKISLFNPRFEQHGWTSRHTAVLVLTHGIPFVSESLRLELNRRGIVIHMLVSSDLTVQRDAAHELRHDLPGDGAPGRRAAHARGAGVHGDLAHRRPGAAGRDRAEPRRGHRRGHGGRRRFRADVRARARTGRRAARVLAGGCRARMDREPRLPGMAAGRQLHLPRLRDARGGPRRRSAARRQSRRHEARPAARARHARGRLPRAGDRGAGAQTRAAAPATGVLQVRAPLARAPHRLSRLHRGQLPRRRRADQRAALLSRAVHRGGLHHGSRGNPDRAAQGRRGDRALAPEHQQPPPAHAQARARGAAARRAVPGRHRHALRHRDAHLPDPGAAQDPAVHPHRPAQPVRLLPVVLAARHLPHRAQAEDRVAADGRAGRRGIGVHHLLLRVGAGAHLFRDAPGRSRAHRLRRRGARGADRAHRAAMAGPARHGARRGVRRGGGRCAASPSTRRPSLPATATTTTRRWRWPTSAQLRRAGARRRAGSASLPQRARTGEPAALPALQPGSPGRALRRDPDAGEPRHACARRTSLPAGARRPARALGARFQPGLCAGRGRRRRPRWRRPWRPPSSTCSRGAPRATASTA